jgi:hypothetical protein
VRDNSISKVDVSFWIDGRGVKAVAGSQLFKAMPAVTDLKGTL